MKPKSRLNLPWIVLALSATGICAAAGGVALHRRPVQSVALTSPTPAWVERVDLACSAARAQGKDVLLQFSAPQNDPAVVDPAHCDLSDSAAFRRTVGEQFILLRMTPNNEMSPAQITQVTTLAERFNIARFPTFILLDAAGKPYARTEMVATDATSFLDELKKLQAIRARRDQCLGLADHAVGIERARHLGEAIAAVGPFGDSEYSDIQREIVSLDPDNQTGLTRKYGPALTVRTIDATIQSEVYPMVDRGDYQSAITRIDRLIDATHPPKDQVQLLLAFKGQLYYSLGDKQRAAGFLDQAIAIDPSSESAERARVAKAQVVGG